MNEITIGRRILAAVIAHQMGISADRALKLYVKDRPIDPSWESVGAELLRYSTVSGEQSAAMKIPRRDVWPSGAKPS